jgi:hypothetical protein
MATALAGALAIAAAGCASASPAIHPGDRATAHPRRQADADASRTGRAGAEGQRCVTKLLPYVGGPKLVWKRAKVCGASAALG